MSETFDSTNSESSTLVGVTEHERNWAMAAHLAAFACALLTSWFFGIGGALGALAVWFFKRDESAFVAEHAKEALNFNVTMVIVAVLLIGVSIFTLGIGLMLTIPAAAIIAIVWFVCTLIAAMRAKEGLTYRYPMTLRLF